MATILLVEDDTSMRLLTTAKLKHRYAIISVQDGVEALDVLERQPVDLIIADVMMGGPDPGPPAHRQAVFRGQA